MPGADRKGGGNGAVTGVSGRVLVDRKGGVDAASCEEVVAHRQSGTLRRNEDHVKVAAGNDARVVLEDDAEAVREVERVAGLEVGLHHRPHLDLSGVREQILEDRPPRCGFFGFKERFALNPAVFQRLVPTAAPAHPEEHLEALVAHVQPLPPTLGSVAEDRGHFILEDRLAALHRVVRALDDRFRMVGNVDLLHRIAP